LAGVGATDTDAREDPPPPTAIRVQRRGDQPLFHAIDTQSLSEMSNRALVDPVLFRVLYATGLRISEALNLPLRDVDLARATLEVRDSKNRESRVVPITTRLADSLQGYIAAARRPGTRPPSVPHPRADPTGRP